MERYGHKIQGALRNSSRRDQKKNCPQHIIVKALRIQDNETTSKATREKSYLTKSVHSSNTRPLRRNPKIQRSREWYISSPYSRYHPTKWFYTAKLFFKIVGDFRYNWKLQQLMNSKSALQEIPKGILQEEKEDSCKHDLPRRINFMSTEITK